MTMKLFSRRSQIPGSRFNPSDVELVNYLRRRIERNNSRSFITNMDVYDNVPWHLEHVSNVKFMKNQWFYFVERKKLGKKPKADSTRMSRTVGDATWKGNTLTPVMDKEGVLVGFVRSFTLQVHGKGTGWLMHEFVLDKDEFQQPVLCRLRFHPGKTKDNAQFAPRLLQPQVIRQPPGEENNKRTLNDAAGFDITYVDATPQQWNGSGEAVSRSLAQSMQFMGQGSNYPVYGDFFGSYGQQQISDPVEYYGQGFPNQTQVPMMIDQALNGPYSTQPGMVQHGYFGSSGHFVGESSTHQLNQLDSLMNQQQWNGSSGPYSTQPDMMQHGYFGSSGYFVGESSSHHLNQGSLMNQQQWNGSSGPYLDQGMMQHHNFSSCGQFEGESSGLTSLEKQYCEPEMSHQWTENSGPHSDQGMMQRQNFGSCGQFEGESSGQGLGDMAEYQTQYSGHQMDPTWQVPVMSSALNGPSSAQPYIQGMVQHQIFTSSGQFAGDQSSVQATHPSSVEQPYDQGTMEHLGSSTPCLAQSLGTNNDLSMVDHNVVGHLPTQRQHVGQGSNLSLTQQQQCDGYGGPSLAQSHVYQNYNNVESSKLKEDDFMNLNEEDLNLKEEDLKHIMSMSEDFWRNLMSLHDVPLSELGLNEDDLMNFGVEDWEYIKSLGEHGWKNLISSSDSHTPKRTHGS